MSAVARNSQLSIDLDVPLAIGYGLLLLLGLVMVTSASITVADRDLGQPLYYLLRQGTFAVLGAVAALVVVVVPTVVWDKMRWALLVLALLLLVSVLVPGLGHEVNGSVRWLRVGPVQFQPSEPARLFVVMYLAGYLVRNSEQIRTRFSGFVKPLAIVSIVCVLLLAEPDFGAAMVLLATTLGLLFVAGVRFRHFALLFVGALATISALAVSSTYRVKRLTAFLDPWADPFGSGFQLTQSLIAIGRGEWLGVGLGSSVQKLFYLPEAHTDFVFAVLAEELGLIGVVFTLLLFAFVVWRAFSISCSASAVGLSYQSYLACGIGLWLGLQAVINVGVNMGLLPTKGLTLPMLSYGGSSLVATLIAFGLLLRIHHEVQAAGRSATPRGRSKR